MSSLGLQQDKENMVQNPALGEQDVEIDLKKSLVKSDAEVKPVVAPTIKELEADEPLLQENPHRFVLFPLKYHEVRSCFSFSTLRVDLKVLSCLLPCYCEKREADAFGIL